MKKAVAGVSFRTTCGQQGGQSEHYDSDVRVYEVNSTGAIDCQKVRMITKTLFSIMQSSAYERIRW